MIFIMKQAKKVKEYEKDTSRPKTITNYILFFVHTKILNKLWI